MTPHEPVHHVRSLDDVHRRHRDLRVIRAVGGKADVLNAVYRAVDAPAYAGLNYDALADIVGDLGWLPGGPVRLGWAPDVAPITAATDAVRKQVLGILLDAARASTATERPLIVYVCEPG